MTGINLVAALAAFVMGMGWYIVFCEAEAEVRRGRRGRHEATAALRAAVDVVFLAVACWCLERSQHRGNALLRGFFGSSDRCEFRKSTDRSTPSRVPESDGVPRPAQCVRGPRNIFIRRRPS
jgi:hypothetical protein